MLRTTADFHWKESKLETKPCIIEDIVELGSTEFKQFSKNLLRDYDFIADNVNSMFVDSDGVTHALLVLGEGHNDGYLINSSGYNYCRYSALLPNARSYLQSQHYQNNPPCLRDVLGAKFEDVHLCSDGEDHDLATIVELSNDTLTEACKQEWADVLNAKVNRTYIGYYGLQIELSGVDAQRLTDFSYMLAGQCSEKDYDRWVDQSDQDQALIME